MSADLHLHIRTEDLTDDDFAKFFSSSMGSKYFSANPELSKAKFEERIYDKFAKSPNIWIGSVSWLKAALMDDPDTFIPKTVEMVSRLVGEDQPRITDELIEQILQAFELPNNTIKEGGVWNGKGYDLADPTEVKKFLEQYKGYPVFTISW